MEQFPLPYQQGHGNPDVIKCWRFHPSFICLHTALTWKFLSTHPLTLTHPSHDLISAAFSMERTVKDGRDKTRNETKVTLGLGAAC